MMASVLQFRWRWLSAVSCLSLCLTACSGARNEPAAPAAAEAKAEKAAEKPEEAATKQAAANRVQLSAEALKRGQIETAAVGTQAMGLTLEAPGRLAYNEDAAVRVGTIVGGRVRRVLAMVGDHVKKDQALVYLHSHELLDARAAETQARVAVSEKTKALAYAKAEAERADRLLEAKAVSKREHAHAQANVTAAQAELEHAKAELERAAEFLEHLSVPHDSHDDVVINSPINGVVIERNVSVGTVVTEATDLIKVTDLSNLWAIAEVPERDAAAIRTGQRVTAKIAAFPESSFSGRVILLGTQLNPQTRTVQVRCLINNARGQLRPEMSALIQLDTGTPQTVLAVPREAVQEINGARVVFLAHDGGSFEKVVVQPGREQNGFVEITSGLQAGQRVVTRGAFFVKTEFLKGSLAEE